MVSTQATHSQKRWFRHLLRPSWLAGIISVGIHGGLFVASPTFSGLNFRAMAEPENLPEEQRKVPVIELTPAEQQRLPDFSQSFYSFESFGSLEPADPLNPLALGENIASSEVEKDASPPLTSGLSTYNLPIHSPPLQSWLPPPTISLPPPATTPSVTAEVPEDEVNPAETESEEGSDLSEPGQEEASGVPAETTTTEEPSADDLATLPGNPTTEDSPPPENLEEFLARARDEGEELSPEEHPQAFTYNEIGTTEEEFNERFEAWFLDNKATTGGQQIALFEPIQLPISYEPQYCLQEVPHDGVIGALVNSEGTLLETPELLKSTGYLFLDFEAIESLKAQDFSSVKRLSAFQFQVVVDYDPETCVPGLETGASTEGETSESSEATPKTETPSEQGTTSETDRPGQANAPEPEEATEGSEPGADDTEATSD